MDLLLIQRDALASSLVGNMLLAKTMCEAGHSVAILFTQEALAALLQGSLEWPRELSGQEMRLRLADRAKEAGLPVAGRGEGRRVDVLGLLGLAKESGVRFYACPIWSPLIASSEVPPEGFEALDGVGLTDMIMNSRRVIGTL